MTTQQPANAHRLAIGDFTLTTLIDGQFEAGFGLLSNIDETEAKRLHDASRRPTPPRITLNAYLLETGQETILIDTGFGPLGGGAGGRLFESLADAGHAPDDIDTVLITHMHPDHIGGLVDANDQPTMPRARVLVPAGELDYWGGAIPADADDAQTQQFEAAHRVIAAVGSQIQHLEGNAVLPGITRVPLPGHTPDHSGYRIASGNAQLLLWTDIVHLPSIQFPNPEATVAFDSDAAQAAETRRRIMSEVAESREPVAGHHLDFPGVGYVVADGAGFRWLPHVWTP
ncbi:MBL fold metallo-hydrolase [Salinisphaera sp. Q1T1-3]|uniref:MBL fold metallo-hydrolase n=1 Tax=Salinisphaera sp. Q1T1-3 TaxID=2321229 RepID=UPI001F38A70B|nr:MBL fold metallo-hydrolase [Salinisphaera sp. Q1T1-3]